MSYKLAGSSLREHEEVLNLEDALPDSCRRTGSFFPRQDPL